MSGSPAHLIHLLISHLHRSQIPPNFPWKLPELATCMPSIMVRRAAAPPRRRTSRKKSRPRFYLPSTPTQLPGPPRCRDPPPQIFLP
ncbi:hypothetical protein OROMI_004765 [Orobanche minor]